MGSCEGSSPSLLPDGDGKLGLLSNGFHNDCVPTDESLARELRKVQLVEESGCAQNVGEKEEDGESNNSYSHRPNVVDCIHYLKGNCKFGPSCKFNHPFKGVYEAVNGESEKEIHGTHEDVGKIKCKYYLTPGGCKFGDTCRFDHSQEKNEIEPPNLNFLGLPIRPGEKECPFYMRHGSCAYEANCKFHHPDPTEAQEEPKSLVDGGYVRASNHNPENHVSKFASIHTSGISQANMSSLSNWTNPDNGSCSIPGLSTHQGFPQNTGWSQYQAEVSLPEKFMDPNSNQGFKNHFKNTDSVTHLQKLTQIEEFPERPGQPECSYFMKTGDCKYKSACKYHHPRSRSDNYPNKADHSTWKNTDSFINQQKQNEEFPERPGQPECDYFMKTGDCKYRSACRYHHPKIRPYKLPFTQPGVNGHPSRPEKISPVEDLKLPYLPHHYTNDSIKPFKQQQQQQQQQTPSEEYPERPGEPNCAYYIKTGECRYKSACRFHHPKNRAPSASSPCALNDKGLPIRPGSKICMYYEQYGICKYGVRCVYDHPQNSSSSDFPTVAASESLPVNNTVGDEWGDGWVIG
ncbi:hypothetical protein Nepgr_025752 [Nepenthes gracilis]|uniref:C3H1-type domain-containing protein n=1 Tax=Nepenthes gracilis TaxID=150966 RepID=A0AAD3Y1D2_NEPGR|nr:hypothetical protein Nepgr_025752 [Nepenthes gracilis]